MGHRGAGKPSFPPLPCPRNRFGAAFPEEETAPLAYHNLLPCKSLGLWYPRRDSNPRPAV